MPMEFPLMDADSESNAEPVARRFGRYWLLKLIARGGMGEVYLAATTGIEGAERPCVVKIIRREHAKDSSFLARFFDEARVQSQLQHPGVVQIFEASTDDKGEPFVVVEYVEGRSLGEVRGRATQLNYRLTWADAVAVATATAEALVHVHERVDIRGNPLGIVHRDLSPQNVMTGYCGDVKLIDFGTARGQNRRCHTVSGVVYAKPGYVAPEVANGNTGDARVDLYALGVMFWELAAGRRFLQGDPAEHLAAVAKNKRSLPPIAQLVGAPAQLDEVVSKLTAFELDQRYASARAALKDLVSLLSKAPSLPNGERGVRARIAQFMSTIYPAEPTRSRREFARLVAAAKVRQQEGEQEQAAPEPSPSSPPVDDSMLPGTRYRILRKIGEGGIGAVFEAEHLDLDRRVALKVVSAEHAISSDYAARFRKEARALSRLSHPNLVALHDFGQAADGRLFCAMEMLEGETLDQVIAREAPLGWQRALPIAMQAARALKVAHQAGLVHRDLKPSNLFVCTDGTVKLLDFGLAKTLDEAAEAADDKGGFSLFGTPEYMAPEQVGAGTVDARADVYALGCVLYELCTGRLPFVYDTSVRVLDAKLTREAEPPRRTAPGLGLPSEVDQLIVSALARSPEARTATAAALLEQMERALAAPEASRRRRRRAGAFAGAAAVAIAAVLMAGGLTRHYSTQVRSAIIAAADIGRTPATAVVPLATATPAPDVVVESDGPEPAQGSCATADKTVETRPVESAKARTEPADPDTVWRDTAQRAVIARNWPAAVDAARSWVRHAPSHQSRLFLARVLVHTHECRQAAEVLAPELVEQPRSAELKALLDLCKLPVEPEKQAPVRSKDRSKLARVER
jgi:eukaryotic-like serine/threonine-protein kinase